MSSHVCLCVCFRPVHFFQPNTRRYLWITALNAIAYTTDKHHHRQCNGKIILRNYRWDTLVYYSICCTESKIVPVCIVFFSPLFFSANAIMYNVSCCSYTRVLVDVVLYMYVVWTAVSANLLLVVFSYPKCSGKFKSHKKWSEFRSSVH